MKDKVVVKAAEFFLHSILVLKLLRMGHNANTKLPQAASDAQGSPWRFREFPNAFQGGPISIPMQIIIALKCIGHIPESQG